MAFEKKIIAINNEGLKQAEAIAEEKMTLLSKALEQAEKAYRSNLF